MTFISARLTNNPFIDSNTPWKENVIKNALFKIPRNLALIFVFKLFAYWAYCKGDYTSFLMLTESWDRQIRFIQSRSQNKGAIVLVFIFSWFFAATYDTILWALDTPGYVKRSKLGNGNDFPSDLLPNPPYVTIISDPSGDAGRIGVDEPLMSNLFKPTFNFSFPPGTHARFPNAVLPPKLMDPLPSGAGPSIYPDDGSFSIAFAPDLLDFETANGKPCSTARAQDKTLLLWNCQIPITTSLSLFRKPIGVPLIRWGGNRNQTAYLLPDRLDNPWASAGTEGGTAVMKQVFMVTKGNRRHTFLQTTWKASMLTRGIFLEDEVKTMLQRVYAPGDVDALQLVDLYAQRCLDAQKNGRYSTTMGSLSQDKDRAYIGWTSTEFFNLSYNINPKTKQLSLLRVHNTTIEFIRSETIPPVPINNERKANYIRGGKVRWNDYSTPNHSNDFHLGQIDTTAVALIIGMLGNGGNDTNAVALNATGMNWYASNQPRIDQLLLSRAFLAGGDASTVDILVYDDEPALTISYLQVFLIVFPIIPGVLAFLLLYLRDRAGYYRRSLLDSLLATTPSGPHPVDVIFLRSKEQMRIGMKDRNNVMYMLDSQKLSVNGS